MSEKEKVHRFMSLGSNLRGAALCAPKLALEMQKINTMSPLVAVASGRAMIACALLASRQKEDRISLLFSGNGPMGRLFVESSFDGKTRLNVANPHVDLPLKNGEFNVSEAVGIGLLSVTHLSNFQKQSYQGTVIIKTGEIGSDIAFYLEQSFQIPSVIALGVHVSKEGLVNAAGGILIEMMPGHTEEDIQKIEENVRNARPLSEMLLEGAKEKTIIKEFTKGISIKELDHPHELKYHCHCNESRVKNSLILLGEEEIKALTIQEEATEIRCEFCGQKYYISNEELEKLRVQSRKKSMH